MQWTKTRISLSRWEAGGFRITETMELTGVPFTLESFHEPDQEPLTFGSLKQAQEHAKLLNNLAMVNEENARLKLELEERRQADHFERSQMEAELREHHVEHDTDLELKDDNTQLDCGPDGRGAPLPLRLHPRHGVFVETSGT